MIVAILPAMKSKKIPIAQKSPVRTLNGAKPVAWDLKTSKFRPRQIKMAWCCKAQYVEPVTSGDSIVAPHTISMVNTGC